MPTQLALLFFNVLHPPLNVPALGVSLNKDDVDLSHELTGHGVSNLLAGAFGVPSNYLAYVNTLLFYRVGGTTRYAGVLLAAATFGLLLVGTGPIAYIRTFDPFFISRDRLTDRMGFTSLGGRIAVLEVGALIFVLGIDLVKEAVWDTWPRASRSEYITIIGERLYFTPGTLYVTLILQFGYLIRYHVCYDCCKSACGNIYFSTSDDMMLSTVRLRFWCSLWDYSGVYLLCYPKLEENLDPERVFRACSPSHFVIWPLTDGNDGYYRARLRFPPFGDLVRIEGTFKRSARRLPSSDYKGTYFSVSINDLRGFQIVVLMNCSLIGTIARVEDTCRSIVDQHAWEQNPIRFLVIDLALVPGLDLSAAEAFVRVQRLLVSKGVIMVFCGQDLSSEVAVALHAVGLWSGSVEVFATLNDVSLLSVFGEK